MIKDGTISVDKLSVEKLSAVSSDLGNVTAGDILLQQSHNGGQSILPNYYIPPHKTGLFMDNIGLIATGTPVQRTSTETTASAMPVVAVTAGEVRFLRSGITSDIKSKLHGGLSDADYAFIRFDKDVDGKSALVISANGQIYHHADNYTDWTQGYYPGVRWMVQGRLVIIELDLTFSTGGNKLVMRVPSNYLPPILKKGPAFFILSANSNSVSEAGVCQMNAEGTFFLLSPAVNRRYAGTVVFAY